MVNAVHRDESMSPPQRRRRHHESGLREYLHAYRFEIIWLVIVALGLGLIFRRPHIRSLFSAWFTHFAAAAGFALEHMGAWVADLLARLTLSGAIGYALVIGALVAIALRLRWRMLRSPTLTLLSCPRCGGHLHRVHRRAVDHLISLYVPVRRYSCENDECCWHGLRVSAGHGSSRSSARERS
jgi:hypothetical protein